MLRFFEVRMEKIELVEKNYESLKATSIHYYDKVFVSVYYAARGMLISVDRAKRVKEHIKSEVSVFSPFQSIAGNMLSGMLAAEEDADAAFDKVLTAYDALACEGFKKNYFTALASFFASKTCGDGEINDTAFHARKIYDSFRCAHPYLTTREDYMTAVMLAAGGDDGTKALKVFEEFKVQSIKGSANALFTASAILSLSKKEPDELVKEFSAARAYAREKRVSLFAGAFGALATLISLDIGIDNLLTEMLKLKAKKGFGSFWMGNDLRATLAICLIVPEAAINAASQVIGLITAQQAAACCAACAGAAAASQNAG